MGSGKGEALQDWTRNDGGRRRASLKNSEEEGSPYWSRLGMDTGRCLGLGSGSVVPLRYGLYMETTELNAGWCSLG